MNALKTEARVLSTKHRPKERDELHRKSVDRADAGPVRLKTVDGARQVGCGSGLDGLNLTDEAIIEAELEGAEDGGEGEDGEGDFGGGVIPDHVGGGEVLAL